MIKGQTKNIEILFRLKLFSYSQLLQLQKGGHRSLNWVLLSVLERSVSSDFLERAKSKAKMLISNHYFKNHWLFMFVKDVSNLFIFYKYHSGKSLKELTRSVALPLKRPRCTRDAVCAHEICVDNSNSVGHPFLQPPLFCMEFYSIFSVSW